MNYKITQYQQRLFNKLYATLPTIRDGKEFNRKSNLDFEIDSLYYYKNQKFWFARSENKNNYLFLFGILNKPIRNICGNDTCLIIDFDKNIPFNDTCLGLFGIIDSEMHILINNKILKERYPHFNSLNFKISNFKLLDNDADLEVIDLGGLSNDFIYNLEDLINSLSKLKSEKEATSHKINKDSDKCEICSKKKSNFKLDSNLSNLTNLKPELCGKCIEKIIVSEFYAKISPLLKGNRTEELDIAKERFGNDQLFDIGLKLLEKYGIIKYIGVKKLFYFMDNDYYLVKKYLEYSDKDNLLIDNIKINEPKSENRLIEDIDDVHSTKEKIEIDENKSQIPKVVKKDSFGNYIIINQMNTILEELSYGKNEDEAIAHANVSKKTYEYWINRGKQNFGGVYIQFYNYIDEIKSKQKEFNHFEEDKPIEIENFEDKGIYEPLLEEYERSFSSMNQSGIAWVNKSGDKWTYSRNINGKTVCLSEYTIQELYKKVIDQNLIWGIRDYDRAKEFIDIPDDFVIPSNPQVHECIVDIDEEFDSDIYAPLPMKYERSFSSMNQSGIAWVNKIGNKLYYTRSINGKYIRFSDENIYELHKKVKKANQVWGIRDYDRAKEFIDIPDDFVIHSKSIVDESSLDIDLDPDIYAPLPKEYEQQFTSSSNKTGIAWVNKIGKKWIYQRSYNQNHIYITDENLYKLHQKVKKNNLIWGIRDYNKAKKFINIPNDYIISETIEESIEISSDILNPLPEKYIVTFNPNQKNKTGIAWVNKIGKKWVYQRKINGVKIKFDDANIHKLHEIVIKNNQIWGIIDFDKAIPIINSSNKKEIEEQISENTKPINRNKVVVDYIEKPINKVDVIIKGLIKNKDLIDVLTRLELFKEDIKRIIATSINNEIDIFIELEINKYSKNTFEEKIEDLGWSINK